MQTVMGDNLSDDVETNDNFFASTSETGTNPNIADTDGDGLNDDVENPDLPFVDANQPGTDPNLFDTDDDGYSDGYEANNPGNPADANVTPAAIEPLVCHRYSFTNDASDSEGSNDGVLVGGANVSGGELVLGGNGELMSF